MFVADREVVHPDDGLASSGLPTLFEPLRGRLVGKQRGFLLPVFLTLGTTAIFTRVEGAKARRNAGEPAIEP